MGKYLAIVVDGEIISVPYIFVKNKLFKNSYIMLSWPYSDINRVYLAYNAI